ncbi:uncharacterized protein F4807DRAFT_304386 [Annulohypoxylon truncatum]|uniref:uncharacterized protein n=1 Tax=Annulohypoxylon truncatum TaxID=327061 RepID=UPI002008347A|nr:uncharacterized protein F4807DRAFT_304386 [Annulohypoxylon truncatum]KAI1212908.1 hypothetical protein F4807DRAFT_304386 [Annulohypoxylon truncatum]
MSGDQPTPRQDTSTTSNIPSLSVSVLIPVCSFGDPNAQPPTPKQTPTSAAFPNSVFETPKNNRASFDESSGWTPQFAEEYSVFNSTPGNLKGSSHPHFADFSISTPFQPSNHKRPLSTDSIAAEIATHVTHFSPNPNLLPPVDPSRRVPSSPNPLVTGQSPTEAGFRNSSQQLSKKLCRDTAQEVKVQTATPPPSAHKGQRRLAPKLQADTMQNDGFEQEFVAGTPQQQHMSSFMSTTPIDMFGYPMSAPAAASSFGDSRMFWDTDMSGMDLDFSTTGANVFQTSGHRPMSSQDWGKSNEIFQETGAIPPQSQENNQPAKKERALAPKPPAPSLDTSVADSSMFSSSFPASADDSFAMMNHGGVDPGLLFTRPPSSNMEPAPFNPMSQPPLMQSFSQPEPEPVTLVAKPPKRGPGRRTASTKELKTGKKATRVSASSPIKPSDRPGLSRSFSEKITRKPVSETASLPSLAPAARPVPQNTGRSASQGSGPNGRVSPLKNQPHRLPSLSSIPETPAPRTQTSVKFTIDSRGRARAETTTIVLDDDDNTPTVVRRRKEQRGKGKSWASSEDEESSTDDEPIIIPSRNPSFSLPQPRRPSTHSFHSSQRSLSDQSTSSLGIYYNEPNPIDHGGESEAETVMNMASGDNLGDAASELRKVMESRQKRPSNLNNSFTSRAAYSSSATPASTKTNDRRTPSADRGRRIRCVCNANSSHSIGNSYMVQW